MRVSDRVHRVFLHVFLVMALALVGGAGELSDRVSPTDDAGSGTDLAPVEAWLLPPALAAGPVKTESDPVPLVDLAARGTPFGDGTRMGDRIPVRSTVAATPPLYINHCAFLC